MRFTPGRKEVKHGHTAYVCGNCGVKLMTPKAAVSHARKYGHNIPALTTRQIRRHTPQGGTT